MKIKKLLYFLPLILFIRNPFSLGDIFQKPSLIHILGTDNLGRDIYTRLLIGTANTLIIVFLALIIATLIGNIIGIISGYYGGILDSIIQFIIEIILSIPAILISITVVFVIGSGYKSLIIAMIIIYLPLIIRYARGLVLTEKNKEYISAAKTYGVKDFRVMFKHIYINIKKNIYLNFYINFSKCILTEAGLGYLGIGIDPSIPTLGNMLNTAQTYLFVAPLFLLSPSIVLVSLAYIFNNHSKSKGDKVAKKIRN